MLKNFPFVAYAPKGFPAETEVKTILVSGPRGHYLQSHFERSGESWLDTTQFAFRPMLAKELNPPQTCDAFRALSLLRNESLGGSYPRPICRLVATTPRGREIWQQEPPFWFIRLGETVLALRVEDFAEPDEDVRLQRGLAFVDSLEQTRPETLNPDFATISR